MEVFRHYVNWKKNKSVHFPNCLHPKLVILWTSRRGEVSYPKVSDTLPKVIPWPLYHETMSCLATPNTSHHNQSQLWHCAKPYYIYFSFTKSQELMYTNAQVLSYGSTTPFCTCWQWYAEHNERSASFILITVWYLPNKIQHSKMQDVSISFVCLLVSCVICKFICFSCQCGVLLSARVVNELICDHWLNWCDSRVYFLHFHGEIPMWSIKSMWEKEGHLMVWSNCDILYLFCP